MLTGIQNLFNLRYEDRRKVLLMGTVFFLAGISEMLNYTSFMAIFNSRAGTQYLPIMYLIEAFLLPLEGWLLSWFSQRVSKARFMISLYVLFVALLCLNGGMLAFFQLSGIHWFGFYVQLFLVSNFIVRQQTLLMWSTAFDLCPTQQAKRLMPIFVLTAIVGGIVAGIISNVLAPVTGPVPIYLLAAAVLAAGIPNFLKSLRQYLLPLTIRGEEEEQQKTQSTFYYIRHTLRSPFLLAVIGIMTLMPAVYFLMEYQYFTSAQAVFDNEAELTSFYGLMVIILFCAALLLQLFAAKLIERLGSSNTILAISAVFLGCFVLAFAFIGGPQALAVASIGYCLTYLLLYYFAEPGYQFYFKMLPLQHRDGYRFTAQGIASSLGIMFGSGLSMLHSELGVSLTSQAAAGTAAAAALLVLAWITRHLYIKELVKYLQTGTETIRNMLTDFLETMKNDRVRQTLVEKLNSPDEAIQKVTIELFAKNPDPAVAEPLLQYAERVRGPLRRTALMAIHPAGWKNISADRIESLAADEDERVRAVVFRQQLAAADGEAARRRWVERALQDSSDIVQTEALRVMEAGDELAERLRRLLAKGGEAAILACEVIGDRGLEQMLYDVMMCLLDPVPAVRIAAVRAIGRTGDAEAATSLVDLIIGADLELRSAVEQALVEIGDKGMAVWQRFLDSPRNDIWRAVIYALNRTGSDKALHEQIVPSCIRKLEELEANLDYVRRIRAAGHPDWAELARMRSEEISRFVLDVVWTVMERFGDERSIPRLRRALEDSDEEVRDHGLEILSEGIGNARLSAALLNHYRKRLLQPQDDSAAEQTAAHDAAQAAAMAVDQAKDQSAAAAEGTREPAEAPAAANDPWLQALAMKAGLAKGESELMSSWEYLSALDKIVFLKQVSLFHEISLEELGRVASIAVEKVYGEGEYLIHQGEKHRAMFVIVEGHVEVSGRNEDGQEGTIGVFGPKQSIGEAGLFDDRPSPVSAQVLFDQARVLEIAGEEAARLVRLYPDIGIGLLRSMSSRLRSMENLVLRLG